MIITFVIIIFNCYHHHLLLCAIGLYMYCSRRTTNDCLH